MYFSTYTKASSTCILYNVLVTVKAGPHGCVIRTGLSLNIGKSCGVILLKSNFKAAYSVTFDLLILELMFLFFKNTVK